MYQIHLANLQSLMSIDEGRVLDIIERTLQAEQVQQAELSVSFLDDDAIHDLNRKHLQHDYPTDVISFAYHAPVADQNSRTCRGAGLELDGELLVSAETAGRLAEQTGWRAQDELALYVVHGLLHLCGYDDQTADDLAIMRDREQSILKIWNLTPHYGV